MKAMDCIQMALAMSHQAVLMLAEDMRDAPMIPTTPGGNHPTWLMGHITFVEGNVGRTITGEANPVEHWASLFAPGTLPKSDPAAYPPFDEILQTYKDLRQRNLQLLEKIGEAGLDRPTVAPPKGLEHILTTAGNTFLIIAMHHMNHRGQLADTRRAAGRKPIFTPGA